MFGFRKPKPRPAPPRAVHDCVDNIDAWRRYVIAEIDEKYKRICESLNTIDPDVLAKLPDVLHQYEAIEQNVSSALSLMQQEIHALRDLLNSPETMGYTIKPEFHAASGNIEFKVVTVDA